MTITLQLTGDTLQLVTPHHHTVALPDNCFAAIQMLKKALRTQAEHEAARKSQAPLFAYVLAEWEHADGPGSGKVLKAGVTAPRLPDGVDILSRVRKFTAQGKHQAPSLAELGLE